MYTITEVLTRFNNNNKKIIQLEYNITDVSVIA